MRDLAASCGLPVERHVTGDRLTLDRIATAHVRVHRVDQGDRRHYAVAGTLTGTTTTEVQLTGRLRDLELFAEALRAALADARRVGGR